ncbi:FERM, RhoGEF and pleckstrin domain-containing protein [Nesidiocoris tenuis]|uniref:Moesin/ezrin/radixin homolog 1 n=1 Tax=Nesidiocoris tenuis TaxID=355587 RepID=A0ABN7B162_9HEMI|nr:FERM, RhoGEF and pleckstrin domain-containing protein [Nesidiocoris tenuis]
MVDCEGVSLASSCTKLPHSRSAEISKTPPPGAGPKGGGKMLAIRVHMLDDNITLFQVQAKAIGRVLFEQVCKQLHLLEADYFGLEYQDHSGIRYWLDLEKQLSRQVGLSLVEPLLHFCVKFYTPDPAQLEEEFTRYLFCLQIKRDLAQGHLQCNDNTAALMASYIVQAECGDYSADDYPDHTYLSSYKFVQHQDRELEKKIMDNHKKHVGQSPAEADLNLLETARRCELYGMKMHPAKDHEGVPLNLAVAHMGLAVFQNYAKIYTFSWAKVRKISFKRKKFLIKLHPDGYGYYKDVVEFFFESRNECKNLWKKCVENHGFFRCNAVKRVPRQRTRVLSRGSSFRYSGKTQKQMVEFVRENYVKRQNFQRSQSFRQSSSVHSSVATNVGGSISARPLIPLGDNSIVSVSCGSMVHVGVEEGSQSRTFQPTMTNSQTTVHRRTSPEDHHTITSGLRSYNTTSSQTDIVDLIETSTIEEQPSYSWQRSASAKELRKAPSDASYEPPPRERNFIIAGSKTPSFDREAETKVYSSSYPGTTSSLSTESADELEPGGSVLVIDTGSSREFSHDDLSHDSYELLDRENYHNFVHSRSCSIGSSGDNMLDLNDDELFIMDEIVKEDVEKRLGYVEPKYRNMAFNEFNEKCKQGIARFREMNAVEFMEYEAKCKPGVVIGYDEPDVHYPVERTKSEPFVSDFWKVAKQHRKLYHQKSFDYTPTESMDSEERSVTSKSTVDLPYATLKRQQVNGTVQCFECRSPVSPRKDETSPAEFDRKGVIAQDRLTKTKHDSDLNSHDSGLSLSLVGESIDDLADRHNQYLKPNDQRYMKELKPSLKKEVFKFSSEDGYRNKNLLIKSKAQSADSGLKKGGSFDRNPPVEVIKIPSQDGEGIVICSTDDKNISLDTSDPDVIIVEYHSKRKRAFQKRSSSDGKGSFDKDKRMGSLDSATPDAKSRDKKFKEWRSESSSSCDVPASDFKRERFSKEVKTSIEGKVVRETREEKELKKQRSEEIEKKKTEELRKQKSEELTRQKSEDLQKKIERRQEVIDALKKKHEDLNKIEIIKVGKDDSKKKGFSRLSPKPVVQKQEKVIELSPKPEHRDIEKIVMEVPVEINATKSQLRECSEEWSRMEQDKRRSLSPIKDAEGPHESTSPLPDVFPSPVKLKSPVEKPKISTKPKIVEAPKTSSDTLPKEKPSVLENLEVAQTANEPEQMNDGGNKASGGKTDVVVDSSKLTSPELVWKKFGELPSLTSKRERSPILFARLGFSEGSAFAPMSVQSPASSRRAKSLDAPVVSLQRLPPVTSFSSRDDTVDNEESVELEEKTLRTLKPIHIVNMIEEEDSSSLSSLIQDSNMFVKVIEADSSQTLPDVVTVAVSDDTEICQPTTTVVPCVLENYYIELPPCTKMYPEEIIYIEQDQKIPDVTLLSPSYKSKSYFSNQLSDEQKVPESLIFEAVDSAGPSETCDDDDSSFINDVFESSDLGPDRRKSSDVTELQILQGSRHSSAANEDGESRGSFAPSPVDEILAERRPSTRQERLDSFKNTKSYSVDIWTSEETEHPAGRPAEEPEDWEQDDEAFVSDCPAPPPIIETLCQDEEPFEDTEPQTLMVDFSTTVCEELSLTDIQIVPPPPPSDPEAFLEFEPVPQPPPEQIPIIPEIETSISPPSEPFEDKADLIPLSAIIEKIVEPALEFRSIPPKRSFDDDVSSSSSIKPDKATLKPFSLESSGSSSLEEGIFPPDDSSHFADEEEGSSNSAKDDYQNFGYAVAGAELVISGYSGGGVFGLSRTLSRISERSTTSEQERSDFDDDVSTKPSSRSMSVEDESMMSSDRQPSLSSDPSSNNPEIEEHPLPPLPPEPLGFNIPPPLLQPDEEWPSPPNSSFDTPVISNVETYYMDLRPEEPTKVTILPQEHEYDDEESSSDSEYENKTLQEEDGPDSSTKESTVKLAVKMKKPGNSSDTSLGISDFSSTSTGTTVKHCYYSCTVKSDDSSLADFGSSLSTEVLTSSRKNSDDSMNLRRRSYHTPQRSFDDYDSPYSESDESSMVPKRFVNLPSPTGASCGRKTPKTERRMCKSNMYQESPRGGKSIARAKCYSYYSLAKSPPSDGSSSSLELGEPPSTPNTIPRVSKRRRHVPPKRRQRAPSDPDSHLMSMSSPSVVATAKRASGSNQSHMSKQSSV